MGLQLADYTLLHLSFCSFIVLAKLSHNKREKQKEERMKGAIKNSMTLYLGSESRVGSWNSPMTLTMKINQTVDKIEVKEGNIHSLC